MPAVTSRKCLVAALTVGALLPLAAVLPAAQRRNRSPGRSLRVAPSPYRPPVTHRQPEARRVDRVPTPKLAWYACYGNAECATTRLPLDYDQPRGADDAGRRAPGQGQGPEAQDRQPLRQPRRTRRVGHGAWPRRPRSSSAPACSPASTSSASTPAAPTSATRSRASRATPSRARCWPGSTSPSPTPRREEQAAVTSSRAARQGVLDHGRPLSASMSTAEVARDMDVLRRGGR